MINLDDLITQADAARLRQVDPSRISHLITRGRLGTFTIAGKPLVSRQQVLSLERLPGGRPPKSENTAKMAEKAVETKREAANDNALKQKAAKAHTKKRRTTTRSGR